MIDATFDAMGTSVHVIAVDQDGFDATRELFSRCEQRFSRFLPTSELSAINAAGSGGIEVSGDMASVLTVARTLALRTDGLVDIGIGGAVTGWGYNETFDRIESTPSSPTTRATSEWEIDDGRVRLAEGTRLDLGGIAKGWTADLAVESGMALVVSAGGDVRSVDPDLVVDVQDENAEFVVDVPLGIGALATSSTQKRRWRAGDRDVHHLMDPRTMAPAATPIRAATVLADTAVEAEAGAKAVLLRGADGLAWADRQPWIRQAIARWHDENVFATVERSTS